MSKHKEREILFSDLPAMKAVTFYICSSDESFSEEAHIVPSVYIMAVNGNKAHMALIVV